MVIKRSKLFRKQKSSAKAPINPVWRNSRELLSDYLDNSTIHGFKYIGEARSWFEKTWWVVVFLASLLLCGLTIWEQKSKWDHNPFIVTFAEKPTQIWQIPFPAVTICPKNFHKSEDMENFYGLLRENKGYLYSLDKVLIEKVTALLQVCNYFVKKDMDPKNQTDCSQCEDTLRKLSIRKRDMMVKCVYRNYVAQCAHLFVTMTMDEGICYTFNGMLKQQFGQRTNESGEFKIWNWTKDKGYQANEKGIKSDYPHRALGTGINFGLDMFMQFHKKNVDSICRGPVRGFKILFHSPEEAPQMTNHFHWVPFDQTSQFSVKPKMITTIDELRRISPDQRQCYFEDEGNLRLFRLYSQSNCQLECMTLATLKHCGCIRIGIPRIPGAKLCGIGEIECYLSIQTFLMKNHDGGKNDSCGCLPSCNSISYDVEVTQAPFHFNKINILRNIGKEIDEFHYAHFSVVFKDTEFLSTKRTELFGLIDFMANCGGLMGLFMGISFISILEIVYFCTIRVVCKCQGRKNLKKPVGHEVFVIDLEPR